jgi:outer membrane protein TolC
VRHSIYFVIVFSTILIVQFHGIAQNAVKPDLLKDNIESILPPLQTLIDSAIATNPFVRFRNEDIKVNEFKLKSDRMQWTRNIGIQTDIRYGTFNNFSTNTAEGQSPSNLATLSNQLNYGVGAYLKVPLYDMISRNNQINLTKSEIEKAISMAEVQRNEVRQLVIRQYNDLVLKQRLLKNKSKYIETARINVQMMEKEFQNGVISLVEYTRLSEIASRAEADLETSKVEFITAYMILEELVGYKLGINVSVN